MTPDLLHMLRRNYVAAHISLISETVHLAGRLEEITVCGMVIPDGGAGHTDPVGYFLRADLRKRLGVRRCKRCDAVLAGPGVPCT